MGEGAENTGAGLGIKEQSSWGPQAQQVLVYFM